MGGGQRPTPDPPSWLCASPPSLPRGSSHWAPSLVLGTPVELPHALFTESLIWYLASIDQCSSKTELTLGPRTGQWLLVSLQRERGVTQPSMSSPSLSWAGMGSPREPCPLPGGGISGAHRQMLPLLLPLQSGPPHSLALPKLPTFSQWEEAP